MRDGLLPADVSMALCSYLKAEVSSGPDATEMALLLPKSRG